MAPFTDVADAFKQSDFQPEASQISVSCASSGHQIVDAAFNELAALPSETR